MKIAIVGKMRSGKDVVADHLVEKHGFKQFKFSQGINEIVDKFFPEFAFRNERPRKHQQEIGQGMRKLDEDIWTKYTLSFVEEYLAEHGDDANIVISDCRQKNEAETLRDNGFTIIKVEAFTDTRRQRAIDSGDIFDEDAFNHETEQSVDDVNADVVLYNDCDIAWLYEDVEKILNKLKHNR